jgi:hypothetical protein
MPKYNAWKADAKCDPIEGTDRVLEGPSKRWVAAHIAAEEKVTITPGAQIVRLLDGTFWCISKLAN